MAQGDFTELIYDSTQSPIGVSETGTVDRLLGIGTDGTAKVVGITGNYKVLVGGDIVNDHTTGNALTNKMYSCKATYSLIGGKIVADADKDDPSVVGEDAKTYSCKAVRSLITQTTGGSKWEDIASSSPAAIRPKSNKAVVIGSVGSTSSLTVNGDSTLNGGATVSGAAALKGNTTIGTETDAASLSIYGGITARDHVWIGTFENRKALLVGEINFLYEGGTVVSPSKTLSYDSTNGFVFNDKCTATAFYESSDASLKENVAPLSESALSAAASVPLVEFDWKSDGTHSYGTIAQECEKHMPEVVGMGADGKKSVNYIALLCAKVAALEKEVAELKSKVQ